MPAVRSRGRMTGRDSEPKPRSDAYTGLLLLALLAQVAGAVFLYIDWSRYPSTTPDKPTALAASPSVTPSPAAPGGGNPAPAPAPPAAPPAPPMGGGVGMAGGAGMGGGVGMNGGGGVGMAGGAGMGGGVGMNGGGAVPPGK